MCVCVVCPSDEVVRMQFLIAVPVHVGSLRWGAGSWSDDVLQKGVKDKSVLANRSYKVITISSVAWAFEVLCLCPAFRDRFGSGIEQSYT